MDHITDYLFILGFSQEFSTSKCSVPPHLYTNSLYTLIVCFPARTLARYCHLATACILVRRKEVNAYWAQSLLRSVFVLV